MCRHSGTPPVTTGHLQCKNSFGWFHGLKESEVRPSEGDSWKNGDASSTSDVLRMPATAAESESLQYELESPDEQNEQPQRGSKASDAVIGETGLCGNRPRKPSNWEMPYEKKRRRKIAQRQPLYMSLEREIVDVWNSIGVDEGLLSDADIANFLISLYRHGKASEKAGDIAARIIPLGGVCSHCQGLLTLTVSCNTCQIIHGHSQLEKQTACNTSGSQLEKENTSNASSLQLHPESPVVEQVNPLVLTCENSDTSQGLSQTLESPQPLNSRLLSHQPECSQPSPVFEKLLEMESIKGKTKHRLRAPEMPVVRSETAFDLQNMDIVEIKTEPELYNDSDVPDFTEAFPVRIANSKAETLKESDHCEALENTAESVLDCMPIEALETQVVRQEENEFESESNLQRMLVKVVECSDEESVS
ncbi:uncharacterized protein [Littorina saxatilis]|uniref:uncharacterized protein n=1 Tax=Littorina saxatilis TaxID=31220 RepID=UPI0038B63D68